MTPPKELDQLCLACGKRVPTPLRDHEREGAHVPCAPLEFDKRSLFEVFGNQMMWHVSPAQASLQQIVLRAQVVHEPLAFTGYPLLGPFRIGLIVGDDQLNVPAEFLARDRPGNGGQRMRWRTDRYHFRVT